MREFRVYQHPTHAYQPVKVGFSWPAFFFSAIWMLVKKLWGLAGLWFALYLLLSLMEAVTDEAQSEPGFQAIMYLLLAGSNFALALIPGFKGNTWRCQNLERRGYKLTRKVHAETPDAAVAQVAGAAQQRATADEPQHS